MAFKTKAFDKTTLQRVVDEDIDGYEVVEDNIVDTSRWSEMHTMIFEHEGQIYRTMYSQGLTELQDESPFEYDGDVIHCELVELKEVMIATYVPIQEEEE